MIPFMGLKSSFNAYRNFYATVRNDSSDEWEKEVTVFLKKPDRHT